MSNIIKFPVKGVCYRRALERFEKEYQAWLKEQERKVVKLRVIK